MMSENSTGRTCMREITVRRKRALAGILMPYWIIVWDRPKTEFMEQHGMNGDHGKMDPLGWPESRITIEALDNAGIRISSGGEVKIAVPETACEVFVSTMDGNLSNAVSVRELAGCDLLITTRGGLKEPSYPHLETVTGI